MQAREADILACRLRQDGWAGEASVVTGLELGKTAALCIGLCYQLLYDLAYADLCCCDPSSRNSGSYTGGIPLSRPFVPRSRQTLPSPDAKNAQERGTTQHPNADHLKHGWSCTYSYSLEVHA